MTTRELLRPVIEQRGGVLLDSDDGELLVLDRFAKGILVLPRTLEPAQQDEVLLRIEQINSQAETDSARSAVFTVHVAVEDIVSDERMRESTFRLLGVLAEAGPCNLVTHFSRSPADWIPFLDWLYRTLCRFDSLSNHVSLRGPFAQVDEVAKDAFVGMGVRTEFVVGWWEGCEASDARRIPGEALRELARYGLRIPLVCYVHAGNIGLVRSLIDEGLRLNENSGFSLPLVFTHPHYRFQPEDPLPPDPGEYSDLLAGAYDDYPYFDDVFSPLNELAGLVGSGGWLPRWDAPARINLLARPDGVGMFRLIPAFARAWSSWGELFAGGTAEVVISLLDRYKQAFAWEANPFCRRCSWRYVCGGADGWDGRSESNPAALAAACGHRKEFLERFVEEKVKFLLPQKV